MKTHDFVTFRGVPMLAVLVEPGEQYGRLSPDGSRPLEADRPMVEFWDCRHPHDAQRGAQFIARYHAKSLVERDPWQGLLLDGGFPEDWVVSADDLGGVLQGLGL
jgi:hypothetical protein